MGFEDFEESVDLGEPVNLFQFQYGPAETDVFCYTDAEQDIPFGDNIFVSIPIGRSDITSSGTTDKSTMTVEMAQSEAVPELFRVYPPSYSVGLIIWQGHIGDINEDYRVIWSGTVLSCTREGAANAKLVCEPLTISLKRVGLRRNYQYMCPHVLYGPQCRANKAAATVNATVFEQVGRFVTTTTLLAQSGLYAGGILEWENSTGQKEYRTILEVGTVSGRTRLLLSGFPKDVVPGTLLFVSKGCAHTMDACRVVHANILNFGGFPFIPTKNPLGRSTPFL